MNYKILALYIFGGMLSIPIIAISLDLARLATFLFFDKTRTTLSQKLMIKPLIGHKILTLKNIAASALILPSIYLLYYLLFNINKFTQINVWLFLVGYFATAILVVFILFISAFIGRKLQREVNSRKTGLILFGIDCLLLIFVLIIVVFYFDYISLMQYQNYNNKGSIFYHSAF